MITLRPTNLHWMSADPDDVADTCAHSGVEFLVDDHVLVQPSDGDWAVSAAALLLLRTLSRPHTKTNPVGDQLFPHCGRVICAAPDGRTFHIEARKWRGCSSFL